MQIHDRIENIYFHIPFCRGKCPYCDFFSIEYEKDYPLEELVIKEIEFYKKVHSFKNIKNLYFGGGTPSIYGASFFENILKCFPSDIKEITIEFNPEDVIEYDFARLRSIGVNRVSLGVQTIDNNALKTLHRQYDKNVVIKAIEKISQNFSNYSVDRMIGFPDDSKELLQRDIYHFISINVPHISVYIFTLEEKKQKYFNDLPNDDKVISIYDHACNTLILNGYAHYEISNFALDEKYCDYNKNVWNYDNYLGIGPGAVGTVNGRRYSNFNSLSEYRDSLKKGKLPSKIESLTDDEIIFETFFLGLRTVWGIEIDKFSDHIDHAVLEQLSSENLVNKIGDRLILTEKGFPVYNSIITSLFKR